MDEELIDVDERLLEDAYEEAFGPFEFEANRETLGEIETIDDEEATRSIRLALEVYYLQLLGVSLEPLRCKAYLDLVPSSLPLRSIWIGQSTYRYSILPTLASAFAVDLKKIKISPPTIEVLASACYHEYGVPLDIACSVFSNSFVLLREGVLALNVHPFERLSDGQSAKAQAYLAELLCKLVVVSYQMREQKISVVEFGYEATNCMDLVARSIKNKKIKLERISVNNPVFISRSFEDQATVINNLRTFSLSVNLDASKEVTCIRDPITIRKFKLYSAESISAISPRRSIKELARFSSGLILDFTTQEFTVFLRSRQLGHVPSSAPVNAMSSFSKYGKEKKTDDDDNPDELKGYIARVYDEMSSLSSSSMTMTEEAISRLISSMERIESEDKVSAEEIKTLVRDVKNLKSAVAVWSALFYGAYSSLTSDTAAVEATSTVISPIITTKLTKISDEELQETEERPEEYSTEKVRRPIAPSLAKYTEEDEKEDGGKKTKKKETKTSVSKSSVASPALSPINLSEFPDEAPEDEATLNVDDNSGDEGDIEGIINQDIFSSKPKKKEPKRIESEEPPVSESVLNPSLPSSPVSSPSAPRRPIPPSLRIASSPLPPSGNSGVSSPSASSVSSVSSSHPSESQSVRSKRPVPPSLRRFI